MLIASYSFAGTNLLLVGGGKRPPEAMKEFVKLSGSGNAQILIFPWASESVESAELIKSELSQNAKAKISIIPHELNSVDVKKLIVQIQNSTGIFFTGGDQNTLMNFINK